MSGIVSCKLAVMRAYLMLNQIAATLLLDWKLENVLSNVRSKLIGIGCLIMMIIGVVMIIVGIFKIAQGLISHGKTQVSWVTNILLIVVGALFCAGSVFFYALTESGSSSIGGSLANELNELGNN